MEHLGFQVQDSHSNQYEQQYNLHDSRRFISRERHSQADRLHLRERMIIDRVQREDEQMNQQIREAAEQYFIDQERENDNIPNRIPSESPTRSYLNLPQRNRIQEESDRIIFELER